MASITASGSVVPTAMPQWITPEEQLERLATTMAKERVYTSTYRELDEKLAHKITECVELSILRCSDLSTQRGRPSLENLVVDRLIERCPLPSTLTNWYTARKRLNALPEKIPPLPWNIHQILNGKCAIYSDQTKLDGTPYTVGDTHFLQLICQEDGPLNQFENALKAYGDKQYHPPLLNPLNPLQFRFFGDVARQEHGNAPFEPTHWELITKDVIPGSQSQSQSYAVQVSKISALSQKALVNYEVPSLSMSAALFLHKVATKESLYTIGDEQNGGVHTYSRVRESTHQGYPLVVGGSAPSGLGVDNFDVCGYDYVGVGALRKF